MNNAEKEIIRSMSEQERAILTVMLCILRVIFKIDKTSEK